MNKKQALMAPAVSVSIKILIRSQSVELDRDCCPFVSLVAWEPGD